MSSSVRDDFPDPPVPVMPTTGTSRDRAAADNDPATTGSRAWDSMAVMARASALTSPRTMSSARTGPVATRSMSHSWTRMLIICGRPRRWPSVGEKIRFTP